VKLKNLNSIPTERQHYKHQHTKTSTPKHQQYNTNTARQKDQQKKMPTPKKKGIWQSATGMKQRIGLSLDVENAQGVDPTTGKKICVKKAAHPQEVPGDRTANL